MGRRNNRRGTNYRPLNLTDCGVTPRGDSSSDGYDVSLPDFGTTGEFSRLATDGSFDPSDGGPSARLYGVRRSGPGPKFDLPVGGAVDLSFQGGRPV